MKKETAGFLEKAERALRAAEILLREADAESAVGRACYAMLHTAQALLRERGLTYRKHSGVHAAYGAHFAKTQVLDPKFHRWMLAAFDARLKGDYDFETVIDAQTAASTIEQAREFLVEARHHLGAEHA
jgi:uncharacterized protein (UPF0332 family)